MAIRHHIALALAASALTTIAAPASAQQIDRIVTFGDSYADDGNFFELNGINPITGTSNIYTSGRFSGSTNYIDTLSDILGVPVENFAIGGAMARTLPVTNGGVTLPGTNVNCNALQPATCSQGFTYEIDQFFNVGTQATAFPNSVSSFDEGDLVTISIGGNDARQYQRSGGTLANAVTEAQVSIAGATAGLDRLVAAGAPTISFLAGDTGRLPEVATNPTAAAIRTAYSGAFNTGMQSVLAGYAANGVTVHYLDLNTVLDNIIADPIAYGITALNCPADTTCVLNPSAPYLFYVDQLHLTGFGFAIVGNYVAAQLNAPLTLQGSSDVGMDVARQFGRTLTARMDLGSPRDGDLPEGLKFFIAADSFSRSANESYGNAPFDINDIGISAGVEYGFGSGVVGIAANISRPELEFGADISEVEGKTMQVGAYAGMGIAGAFVQGYLGAGWDDYEIDRRGVVRNLSADTDGDHWLAGIKAGYLVPLWGFRVGPVAALDYARVNVEGYTEEGDNALNLNVGEAEFSSLRGSIGAELRGDFAGDGVQFRPFGSFAFEKELSDGDRTIEFSQTTSPGIVNTWNVDDVSKKGYFRAASGLSAQILDNVALSAAISRTMGKKQGNETSGHLGVKIGL